MLMYERSKHYLALNLSDKDLASLSKQDLRSRRRKLKESSRSQKKAIKRYHLKGNINDGD